MSDAVKKPAHYNQGQIECIEAMQQILTPEEFRGFLKGNVFKYLWREKGKNGIEDLRKGKDYYDRLIQSFDESEDQPVVKQSSTTEPPEGWRWLEMGEKFFLGDTTVDKDGNPYLKSKISKQYCERHTCQMSKTFIRRNRFEVGEKVVHVDDSKPTQYAIAGYNESLGAYAIKYKEGEYLYHPSKLAPYIEDAT